MTNYLDAIHQVLSPFADLGTIAASSIAVYLFIAKRKKIGAIVNIIMGYSFQLTISELKEKLERLNDLNCNDEQDKERVILIFHDIIGQVKGNALLKKKFADVLPNLETMMSGKGRLTEPRKRSMVSELRERLRHLGVANFDALISDISNE